MLKLPIKFFDTKLMGIFNNVYRIMTGSKSFNITKPHNLFSIITFLFFGVLWYYDYKILLAYLILTVISISWSFYWLKKRKMLDYFRFQYRSENRESVYEILNGVTEMKLNQYEDYKINEWRSFNISYLN